MIPFARPDIGHDEIERVRAVLESGWLTTGEQVHRLERELADYVGAKHAVALSSGTAALHLALEAIGLKAGDEVIVPAYTFTATAEVVCYFDATPVTKPGLHGRTYPRDFLRSVKKEGFGRIVTPVNGHDYIRYNGGNSFAFGSKPTGGGGVLVARFSAAIKSSQNGLRHGVIMETPASTVRQVFGSTRWKIMDTGGGLRRWQIDCYYGEDEPLGPGRFMARPRGTTFEYAYSDAKIVK